MKYGPISQSLTTFEQAVLVHLHVVMCATSQLIYQQNSTRPAYFDIEMKVVKESGKANLIYTDTGSYNCQLDLIDVCARAHASSIPTITLFSSPLAVCIQSCNL